MLQMCEACTESRHQDCGRQTWCNCDCDPDGEMFGPWPEDPYEGTTNSADIGR